MPEIRVVMTEEDAKGVSSHYPMHDSPRCGAKTRDGTPCQAPAVFGKRRCRMHGGAKGSGAPKGNKNALKHGEYSAENKAALARVRELARHALAGLKL